MEEISIFSEDMLSSMTFAQDDYLTIFINFSLCIIMSFIVKTFYIRRSFSLTGKMHIGPIIPILSAVVFLVIMVVKSSLALSLGLVGALSIVRFRTPIKEPEELVYLFLAIALGLGYAAGYTLMTTAIMSLILLIIYLWLSNVKVNQTLEYNLVITWGKETLPFERISDEVSNVVESLKLVRLERSSESNTAVLLVSPNQNTKLDDLINQLTDLDDQISVSFYEAKANW